MGVLGRGREFGVRALSKAQWESGAWGGQP